MRSKDLDAVILTGNDPHNSEYSAERWHQVAWVSGYTGEGDGQRPRHAGCVLERQAYDSPDSGPDSRRRAGRSVKAGKDRQDAQVDAGENEFGRWLRFEPLTLCHFDTSAIIADLLDRSEIDWLNAYNEQVYRTISPRLSPEVSVWLRKKTRPIAR